MNKLILLVIVVAALGGGYYFYSQSYQGELAPAVSMNESVVTPTESTGATVTADVVAQHNTQASCWIVYGGKVYDVTAFLPLHPGGTDTIASHCGKVDGGFAVAFEGRHGTSQVESLETKAGAYEGSLQ